jgi:hypothetical protein
MSILTSSMETRIIIFLAFTSVALLFNAFIIWFAYKAFASTTMKVAETVHELQTSESAKEWLRTLESASFQAITVTDTVKTQMNKVDPVLARAHSKWGFRLAQVDIHMEKGVKTILEKTDRFQNAISEPVNRLSATLHGVSEVVQYLSGQRNTDEPDPTPKP